jgi:hypothetical protein
MDDDEHTILISVSLIDLGTKPGSVVIPLYRL